MYFTISVFLISLCSCRFSFFFLSVRFFCHYLYWKIWSEFFSFLCICKSIYLPWCRKIFLLNIEVNCNFFFFQSFEDFGSMVSAMICIFVPTISDTSLCLHGLYGFSLDFKWLDYNGPCCCFLCVRYEMLSHSPCVEGSVPRAVFRGMACGEWLDHEYSPRQGNWFISDVFRFDGGIGRLWALGHQAHWSEWTRVRGWEGLEVWPCSWLFPLPLGSVATLRSIAVYSCACTLMFCFTQARRNEVSQSWV